MRFEFGDPELCSKNHPKIIDLSRLIGGLNFPLATNSITLRAGAVPIPALQATYTFLSILKLRGSAAPAPKTRPDHGRRAPRTRKSSHFERVKNHSFLTTLVQLDLATMAMQRPELLHAPGQYNYLGIF